MSEDKLHALDPMAEEHPSNLQLMAAYGAMGITFYLGIEVTMRLLLRCTRLSLYFWACLIGILAINLHAILLAIIFQKKQDTAVGVTVLEQFTGPTFKIAQSIVLYSRLHLVMQNSQLLRYVLWLIIFTAVFVGLPSVVTGLLVNTTKATSETRKIWFIFVKAVSIVFFVQETLISLLYVHATVSCLRNRIFLGASFKPTRRILYHLISVNILIVCLESTRIACFFTYPTWNGLQNIYIVVIYAVKLRLEFTVLNQLQTTMSGNTTHLPSVDVESSRGARETRGSVMELPDRRVIQKKVVFTVTSREELVDPDSRSSKK